MKKILAVILGLSLCAGLVGCGNGGTVSGDDSSLSASSPKPELIASTEADEDLKTVTIGALTAELPNDWKGEETSETTCNFTAPKVNGAVAVIVVSIIKSLDEIGGLKVAQDAVIKTMSSSWENYSPIKTTETVISEYYATVHTFKMTQSGMPILGKLVAVDNGQNLYLIAMVSTDGDSQEIRRTQFEDFLETVKIDQSKVTIAKAESQDTAADKAFIQESVNALIPDSYKGKAYSCDVLTKTDGNGYILSIQLDIGTDKVTAADEGFIKMWKGSFAELKGVEEVQISLVSNSKLVDLEESSSSAVDIESILSKENLSAFRDHVALMEFEELNKKLKKEDTTNDAVQELLELSSEAAKLKEKLTAETDDIEGDTLYYYGNVKKLTDDIHFSTVIDNRQLKCKVGFYNSEWLFFNKVVIKPDNSENMTEIYKGYDIETDIVDGGIREWAPIEFFGDEIKNLSGAKSAVIRFINSKKEEHLDFDITKEELDAFKYISRIDEIKGEIEDILYNRDRD